MAIRTIKRLAVPGVILLSIVLSRVYIWIFRPVEFSEIIYSYMPYAHLWASGVKPYLEQWYEYPPVTIPLFYLPHLIDMNTWGHWWHLNYLQAYRGLVMLVDLGIIWLVWQFHRRSPGAVKITALIFYSGITMIANHFMYDSMDLVFAAALVLGLVSPFIWQGSKGIFGSWLGYFLAVGLKYINAPLGAIYAQQQFWQLLKNKKKLLMAIIAAGLAGMIVWGYPLAAYRSSLQVSVFYHQLRGIQVDSTAGLVMRTVHLFTKSEQVIEVYKNYEIAGPVSEAAKPWVSKIFNFSIVGFVLWGSWWVYRHRKTNQPSLSIWLTMGYILLFMLTGKVLSRPFLLWLPPLVAILPLQRVRLQLMYMIPVAIIFLTTLTRTPDWQIGMWPLPLLVGWLRVGCLLMMFGWWVKEILHVKTNTD